MLKKLFTKHSNR